MDNSASLLLSILEEGRKKRKDLPASEVWIEILGAKGMPQLIGALGDFLSLTERAASDVLRVHGDADGVNYWRTRIYNGFHSTALGQPWQGFRAQIDEISIFTLKSHAKILEMNRPLKGLAAEEISKGESLFDEALAAISDASLDQAVRVTLITRIEQIQALLNRYRYVGPDAISDAAKVLAAELLLTPADQIVEIKRTGAYAKIREGLEVVANASQVASTAYPALAIAAPAIVGLLS